MHLQAEPEFRRESKIPSEPEGCVRGDRAGAPHDLAHPVGRHAKRSCHLVHTQAQRIQQILFENAPWMHRGPIFHCSGHSATLVIISNLHIVSISVLPSEHETELVVDPHAVLSKPISL